MPRASACGSVEVISYERRTLRLWEMATRFSRVLEGPPRGGSFDYLVVAPANGSSTAKPTIGGQAFEHSDGEPHRCYSPLSNELLHLHLA